MIVCASGIFMACILGILFLIFMCLAFVQIVYITTGISGTRFHPCNPIISSAQKIHTYQLIGFSNSALEKIEKQHSHLL